MFGGFSGALGGAGLVALLFGFGYAAVTDLRVREAPDGLWVALGAVGVVLGLVAFADVSVRAALAWLLVAALVLQHFAPWDAPLERRSPWIPLGLEVAAYLGVGAVLVAVALPEGIGGPLALPAPVLAAYAAVVLARALFELGLLYGGADAKALIAAALLAPLDPPTLLHLPWGAARIASVLPGPLTLLMDAALLSVAVPVALAVRNLRAGEFGGASSFVGYRIPVEELPERFVWLKDPLVGGDGSDEPEPETTAEDVALRRRQMEELRARGIDRVWVTPQLPFLVFFLGGAIAMALAGNLLFDLLATL